MGNSKKHTGVKSFFICLLVLVIAAAAAGYFWFVPTQYELAMAKKEAGHFDEAITALKYPSMLGYKDSAAQITECETGIKYNAAKALAESGKYEEAVSAFKALGSFLDSKEQAAAAEASTSENLYLSAKALADEGKYEEAKKAFAALGDFFDASVQAEAMQAAINQQAYDAASTLLGNGKYEEAQEAFAALGDFSDASAQAEAAQNGIYQQAYDAAKALLDDGRYKEAKDAFAALGDFSDASAQAEVAQNGIYQAAYDAAKTLFDEGKYEEAKEAFIELGNFSDASAQAEAAQNGIYQTAYDVAKSLFDEGKLEEARDAFTELGDFSDAASQAEAMQEKISQAAYDAAKALFDEGKYEEALDAFAALGDFSDAAMQVEAAQNEINQIAYDAAKKLLDEGKFREASEAFASLGSFSDAAEQYATALSNIPGVDLNETEVSTKVGERISVTATLHGITDPDSLTITGSEPSYSVAMRNDSYYLVGGNAAELVEKTADKKIMTMVFEGAATTGTREFSIAGPDGTVYATLTVNNTGISDDESTKASSVNYIGDRSFFKYDNENVYILNFSLKDSNEKNIDAPAFVTIRIENDDGITVYDQKRYITAKDFGTWTSAYYGSRYMAGVRIQPEDIIEGNTTSGTVYFTVELPGYFGFSESQVSASELPTYDATKDCSLDAPEVSQANPINLKYRSYSAVQITELKYEFIKRNNGNVDLKLSFSGAKSYDSQGDNHSGTCNIGFKLYDPEGYVLESGSISTTSVATGEKFRNVERTFRDIAPGAYKLVLLDVD